MLFDWYCLRNWQVYTFIRADESMKPRHETECHVCERRLVFHANIQVRVWLRTCWSRRRLLIDLFFAIFTTLLPIVLSNETCCTCYLQWASTWNVMLLRGACTRLPMLPIAVSLGYSLPACLHLAAVKVRCKATMGIWPCILGHKSKSIGSRFETTMTKRLGQWRAQSVVIFNQLAPEIIVTKMRVIWVCTVSTHHVLCVPVH